MNEEKVAVNVIIPKAIGNSASFALPSGSTIMQALHSLNQQQLVSKLLKSETEFSQFVLVYLNGQRTKDPSMRLVSSNTIEIIIPMAGG